VPDLFEFVDREIWIITSADGERRGGLVATWVQSSSLDPDEPIVTVSISDNHFTRELIDASGAFGLHLLAENQTDLAFNFCRDSGRDRDKLAGMHWQAGATGCPLLADCLAAAECRVVDRYEAAGRVLYFADVVSQDVRRQAPPLSEQHFIQSASPEQRAKLRADRQTDVRVIRHAIHKWRKRAGRGT
jgi:flavin reductase (DIM6/NTAB) family NADH-FMN oxidoreductase RutF